VGFGESGDGRGGELTGVTGVDGRFDCRGHLFLRRVWTTKV
jgi:hypothetical protein